MAARPEAARIAGWQARTLDQGWRIARTAAGECEDPEAVEKAGVRWHDAERPGTVASVLQPSLDQPAGYDDDDWWYRVDFARPEGDASVRHRLRFEGLATIAQAWLNGKPILASANMFVAHTVEVTDSLAAENHLHLRFASLSAAMKARRPRPRWKTALVGQQNLRWHRTTLLGRIPGWTPAIEPVGPWAPVVLERAEGATVEVREVRAWAHGNERRLRLRAEVQGATAADARLVVGGHTHAVQARPVPSGLELHSDLEVEGAPLWWPHTHGEPARVPWHLEIGGAGGWVACAEGMVGFKEIALDSSGGAMRFVVNGVPLFCRGACWMPADLLRLRADAESLRAVLVLARDAGLNMLRIPGTLFYESDAFYDLCDELGILLWQDFMFANMDYPVEDDAFRAEIEEEARQQLARLGRHACLAAYCGGSEVAQQAAMMGRPPEEWLNPFFAQRLPELCAALHPGIPYFPATPWGGAMPFHVATGISHYYGVGAYRRPLSDLRAARVRFTTECLGFSNVPEPGTMALLLDGATPPPHHPRWKARVPRDNGAGWDFEDVRDHYLALLFGVDPVALRSIDMQRYYAMSRVVTGEVMGRAYSEWRSPQSTCGGALVWFLRDLLPGAGWGILDSTARPKAAYWHLKRAWAKQAVCITDEGLDGLALHVVNEAPVALEAELDVEMFHAGRVRTAARTVAVSVAARASVTFQVDQLLGYFSDGNWAYRFGPPRHEVVVARLRLAAGEVLSEDFHFPAGMGLAMEHAPALETRVERRAQGVALTLAADAFLQSVRVSSPGHVPDDNYFHLVPRRPRTILFLSEGESMRFRAEVSALNLAEECVVREEG